MSLSDPLADMLTRIRNGQRQKLAHVLSPVSKMRKDVLNVLVAEGYIAGFEEVLGDSFPIFKIFLKYAKGAAVIHTIARVSTPGRRKYQGVKKMPIFYNGLGCYILSTPKGVMTDHAARSLNVGGEVLCKVF